MAGEDPVCDKNSVIKNAFINHKNGSQDFQDATITSSAIESSFENRKEGSQNFLKTTITSPAVQSSFVNSGSGHQNFRGLTIDCNRSIGAQFTRLVNGMSSLFNYDGSDIQEFPRFKFIDYLRGLPAKLTQNTPAKEEGKPVEVAKSSSSIPKSKHKTSTSKRGCEENFFKTTYYKYQ